MPTIINIMGIAIQNPIDLIVSINDEVVPFWNRIMPIPITAKTVPMYIPITLIFTLSKTPLIYNAPITNAPPPKVKKAPK